ncbi:MAG TPA: argininosuccinate lyase [Longimicrobiales bacterium]|nr:argininosuccinate lyase [Longimicrobiales bacterium]
MEGTAGAASPAQRLWGGRFGGSPAASLEQLNRSLPLDVRLWREDLEGSRAWIEALHHVGVLTPEEADTLAAGLKRVAVRIEAGAATGADDEDIHSLVERLLYEEAGPVAGRLHTGRSRNDQVATDARLWAMRAADRTARELEALQHALLTQAAAHVDTLMPAYTHLRRAQPTRAAQWLLAHFWALQRDRERLLQARARTASLPLGSGAITGSGFPVDRARLQQRLGFDAVAPNALDAVSDRDWVCELAFVAALAGTHLSRLAEDLIFFSSDELRFVALPEAYTTGSSLMPQKRNPDGLELARGLAARLIAELNAALVMLKGLPSGYNKDLQEDKRILFTVFDTLALLLPVTRETIAGLLLDRDRLAAAAEDDALLATDLADELVRRGLPFREAHHAVGRLLRAADVAGCAVTRLPPGAWAAAHPLFLEPSLPRVGAEASVEARTATGGAARAAILAQLDAARTALA